MLLQVYTSPILHEPVLMRQANNQTASRLTDVTAEFLCVSYLGGEEGPAVGGGAAAACAAAVVRHRPLQAQLGTARCRVRI